MPVRLDAGRSSTRRTGTASPRSGPTAPGERVGDRLDDEYTGDTSKPFASATDSISRTGNSAVSLLAEPAMSRVLETRGAAVRSFRGVLFFGTTVSVAPVPFAASIIAPFARVFGSGAVPGHCCPR